MLRILHTNDFHGVLDDAREARLQVLRAESDLYLDAGDAIRAGNLAVPVAPDPIWQRLERLQCDASASGNRESHLLDRALRAKLEGAKHPVLCGNLRRRGGGPGPLLGTIEVERAGLRVGVLAVMVPMVTERMAARAVSQFIWDEPIGRATEMAAELRPRVDCLIALTHIGFKQDRLLAERCPHLDLIIGGHSHTVLEQPVMVGGVAICQAGSHGRFAGHGKWDAAGGLREYRLEPLT